MVKHCVIALLVSLCCSPVLSLNAKVRSSAVTESPRPNILFIHMEDMGV